MLIKAKTYFFKLKINRFEWLKDKIRYDMVWYV